MQQQTTHLKNMPLSDTPIDKVFIAVLIDDQGREAIPAFKEPATNAYTLMVTAMANKVPLLEGLAFQAAIESGFTVEIREYGAYKVLRDFNGKELT